jgi:hypothetical protein
MASSPASRPGKPSGRTLAKSSSLSKSTASGKVPKPVASKSAKATLTAKAGASPAKKAAFAAPKESSKPTPTKPQESKASVRGRKKSTAVVPTIPARSTKAKSKGRVSASTVRPALLEGDLPASYGMDRLVAIPKDPDWTHLYWETTPESQRRLSESGGDVRLRGFDTTGILFDGGNAPVALDIELAPYARSWYAKLPYQGRVYTFEYGWVDRDGEWTGIARSLPVGFEPGMLGLGVGNEEWISIASEELFRAASGLGDGEGIQDLIRRLRERALGSSQGGAAWLTSWGSGMGRLEVAPSSWAPSSFQLQTAPSSWSTTSIGSGVSWSGLSSGEFQPPKNRPKDFWLWVETELILYGATEPDAQVTLMGRPLQLNPDGTFRVHFPFPHGTELKMDVRAVDKTGEQVREAKPAARRWTD